MHRSTHPATCGCGYHAKKGSLFSTLGNGTAESGGNRTLCRAGVSIVGAAGGGKDPRPCRTLAQLHSTGAVSMSMRIMRAGVWLKVPRWLFIGGGQLLQLSGGGLDWLIVRQLKNARLCRIYQRFLWTVQSMGHTDRKKCDYFVTFRSF